MSTDEREKRWMAYMDGQMSTSEALEFERSLSSLDKERMGGEVRLESAVCESLMGRECCPGALWASLTERMCQTEAAPVCCAGYYWLTRGATVLAATAVVVAGALFMPGEGSAPPRAADIVSIDHTTVEQFASEVEVPPVFSEAQRFLNENRIAMDLINPVSHFNGKAHDIEFLGACTGKCPKKSIIELRFSCCGEPAVLLVARQGSFGAEKIQEALRSGKVQEIREEGGYVTGVACGHDSKGLLEMLRPRNANLI